MLRSTQAASSSPAVTSQPERHPYSSAWPLRWEAARSWLLLLIAITALGAMLRLVGLSAVALWGDEYNSIDHATTGFGAELTSLLYSAILRGFLALGDSVYIMRLPAALFGIAAVPVVYLLGRAAIDRRAGLIAALLMATSAYALGYSQEVRFYSLFLFAATLSFHATAMLARDGASSRRIAWWLVANALCLAAHGLGILVVVSEVVSLIILTSPPGRARRRLAGLVAVAFAAGLIVSVPQVRAWGFHLLARYTASHNVYTGSRGLHLSNVVKIAWTFFVFAFGERVYPLWLWLTVPGALVIAVLFVRGLWALRGNRLALGLFLPPLILSPVLLYLVLDALTTSGYQGASPRYLIPLLGPFFLVIAAGIASWRVRWAIALSLALAFAVNGTALAAYWRNDWNYNGYSPDWPRVAALVERSAVPGAVILVDGRSTDPANYYLKPVERAHHLSQWPLTAANVARLGNSPRVVVVADPDFEGAHAAVDGALDALERRYSVVAGFVRYPLFVYVFDRAASPGVGVGTIAQGWRSIPLPVNIYNVGLADLALPATIRVPGSAAGIVTRGALSIPTAEGAYTRTIALPVGGKVRQVLLATTLDGDAAIPAGAPVAQLTMRQGASRQTIMLRKGQQVDDWARAGSARHGAGTAYTTGYTWTKLASLVGLRSYPEAYRQFTAGIAVAVLPLSGQHASDLTIRYLAPVGTLHLWALATR